MASKSAWLLPSCHPAFLCFHVSCFPSLLLPCGSASQQSTPTVRCGTRPLLPPPACVHKGVLHHEAQADAGHPGAACASLPDGELLLRRAAWHCQVPAASLLIVHHHDRLPHAGPVRGLVGQHGWAAGQACGGGMARVKACCVEQSDALDVMQWRSVRWVIVAAAAHDTDHSTAAGLQGCRSSCGVVGQVRCAPVLRGTHSRGSLLSNSPSSKVSSVKGLGAAGPWPRPCCCTSLVTSWPTYSLRFLHQHRCRGMPECRCHCNGDSQRGS
jgi:hypothetical protein